MANPVPDVKEHILEKSTIAISLLNLYPLSNKNDLFLSNHTKGKWMIEAFLWGIFFLSQNNSSPISIICYIM